MTTTKLLEKLLRVNGIRVKDATMNDRNELELLVTTSKGNRSKCPICGKKCKRYDAPYEKRRWRSMDFGSTKVFLISSVGRVQCPVHGVRTESVIWARRQSRFTREFENYIAWLAIHINKTNVSKLVRISWNTIGPILSRVKEDHEPDSKVRFKDLRRIGIDETSYRKGHKYVTVILNHDTNEVVWVTEGHSKEVLNRFMEELTVTQRAQIALVSGDGARWIKGSVDDYLPNAEFCIDGFHVVSWCTEALDDLRKEAWRIEHLEKKNKQKKGRGRPAKEEVEKNPNKSTNVSIKNSRYSLGKNPENLTPTQSALLEQIKKSYPKIARGYALKESLRSIFKLPSDCVERELNCWLNWACRSKIKSFVNLSKKIRRHKKSIVATVTHGLSNARLESMNNKIKVLIRQSYGFRNMQNMIDMILFVCSNIPIRLPYEMH